ncbi:MAG: MATE family efflux transporter [Clostridia bacterium]|nr:MATE family efflux transporter [Clostridia bacterium]
MQSRAKTLVKYVLPTVLSCCCFFLFTIIDGIFIGNGVGADGLGAVNIAFPFVMVVGSLFMLTTVGGVTITAIRIGRGDHEGANQSFMHAITGTVSVTVVLTLIGVLLAGPLARLLGATDTYYEMAKDYLFWYSVFLIPSGLSMTLQHFCRNDGSPVLVSAATIISTAFNIFGDWLFVFPLKMGLAGAAIATGLSQLLTFLILVTHFIRRKGILRVRKFKLSGTLIKKIMKRGLPESVAQLTVPITTICTNYVLLATLGDAAVNAFSIICYVASFSVAIFIGSSQGLQPLFGQCYGAKNEKDLKYYYRAGMLICLTGSLLVTVALYFVGGPIAELFGADAAALECTVVNMPIYSWGFIFAALNTMLSAYLYSTKRTKEALILNLLRSFVFNTVITVALPLIFHADLVWYTYVIYEALVFLTGWLITKHSERNGIQFI